MYYWDNHYKNNFMCNTSDGLINLTILENFVLLNTLIEKIRVDGKKNCVKYKNISCISISLFIISEYF